MIKKLLFILFIANVVISCSTDVNEVEDVYGENNVQALALTADETKLINLVNTYRSNNNLKPLKLHVSASSEAKKHSDYMLAATVVSHDNWTERANAINGEDPIQAASENVAKDENVNHILRVWKGSVNGHNETLLGDYTHAGVGIVKCQDGNLWTTMIFVKK
ncbi:MAG: CAP domain-containing protein [Flavobacteriaceae bacterium]|nr:CAP domain-containing protein [Flavobacteriaceae bacterium]